MNSILKSIFFIVTSLTNFLTFCSNKEFFKVFCSSTTTHPFDYDLGIKLIPAIDTSADYLICFHGSGGNNRIGQTIKNYNVTNNTIISFNFPDYNQRHSNIPEKSTFGTIDEILPALYVIKKCVIEGNLKKINLYGFSAGGGVIVNILAILSNFRFAPELLKIGITAKVKDQIIEAIENGLIILDCPLKSIEEIINLRGISATLKIYEDRYRSNNLRPIDSIATWKNLKLTILLNFQTPDEILSNRDDQLFINAVKKHNRATTQIITSTDASHNAYHKKLWDNYQYLTNKNKRFILIK